MGICDSSNNSNQNLNQNRVAPAPIQNQVHNQIQKPTPVPEGKYFQNEKGRVSGSLVLDNNVLVSETNQQIDDIYERVKKLGEGAFGEVWLVKHKLFGKMFALKIIEKGPYSNDEEIINEIEILKKLDHPFILKILEFHSTPSRYYIVTDFCPEGELFDEVAKRDVFTERDAAYVLYQVLSAIRYCHKMRVFHRDLKPENIMIIKRYPEGMLDVRIIDFGTAKIFKENAKANKVVGSSYYIAPEVLKGKYDEGCDIWSIGVIMYILLVGNPPFNGDTDEEIMDSVASGKYETDIPQFTCLSENARDLISHLLKYNPLERYSAEEALNHPWFSSFPEVRQIDYVDPAIAREFLLNLENYKADNIIRCAVLAYLVHQNTDLEQCINASKLFRSIDNEHDGKLERKELVTAYKTYLNLNDQQAANKAEYVFNNIDNDKSGMIESEEFIRACINPSIFTTPNYLKAAFSYFDDDGGGSISLKEVEERFFQNSNQSQEAREKLRAMFEQIDVNKDGTITFDEFSNMLKGVIG